MNQRTIKFRAWSLEGKHMITSPVSVATIVARVIREFRPSPTGFGSRAEEVTKDDYILMQFTGLKDKNGKEIYEGDIVRASYDQSLEYAGGDAEVREVIWGSHDDHFYPAFELRGNEMETNALSYAANNGELEVIGNVHQNTDLLK